MNICPVCKGGIRFAVYVLDTSGKAFTPCCSGHCADTLVQRRYWIEYAKTGGPPQKPPEQGNLL